MTNVSGMDYNNTPFSIPGQMVSGQDSPSFIRPSYISADRRNIEQIVRHFNANSKTARKAIDEISEEMNMFKDIWEMSEDTDTIVISIDRLKRILSLVENLNLSFDNLLKTTE
jgi:hypothetical protein